MWCVQVREYLLEEREAEAKEAVWRVVNGEYLEEQEAKRAAREAMEEAHREAMAAASHSSAGAAELAQAAAMALQKIKAVRLCTIPPPLPLSLSSLFAPLSPLSLLSLPLTGCCSASGEEAAEGGGREAKEEASWQCSRGHSGHDLQGGILGTHQNPPLLLPLLSLGLFSVWQKTSSKINYEALASLFSDDGLGNNDTAENTSLKQPGEDDSWLGKFI